MELLRSLDRIFLNGTQCFILRLPTERDHEITEKNILNNSKMEKEKKY